MNRPQVVTSAQVLSGAEADDDEALLHEGLVHHKLRLGLGFADSVDTFLLGIILFDLLEGEAHKDSVEPRLDEFSVGQLTYYMNFQH